MPASGLLQNPARRGFTLLELVIVVCIIALLVAFALERLVGLRVDAERAAMGEVLGALRAGVALELVSLIVRGSDDDLANLHEGNPMDSLMQTPATYLGELAGADPAEIRSGHWYFDQTDRLLVYRVRYSKHFETELVGPPRARFRMELGYRDVNRNGRFDSDADDLKGIRIRAVEPYRWRDEHSGTKNLVKKR